MDFEEFSEHLRRLRSEGWKHQIIDTDCNLYPMKEPHKHLRLRLKKPKSTKLITPLQAVMLTTTGARVISDWHDPLISIHSLGMASDFIDWLRSGHYHYVRARMKMLEDLGISEDEVKKLAPEPRG